MFSIPLDPYKNYIVFMTGHKGLVCWCWRFRHAWLLAQNHETASYWSQSHKYHLCYGV